MDKDTANAIYEKAKEKAFWRGEPENPSELMVYLDTLAEICQIDTLLPKEEKETE